MEIAFGLGMELMSISSLRAEAHLAKTHVDPLHAATVYVSSCVHESLLGLENIVSLKLAATSGSYKLFASSPL